jgi:hypothetical protein
MKELHWTRILSILDALNYDPGFVGLGGGGEGVSESSRMLLVGLLVVL